MAHRMVTWSMTSRDPLRAGGVAGAWQKLWSPTTFSCCCCCCSFMRQYEKWKWLCIRTRSRQPCRDVRLLQDDTVPRGLRSAVHRTSQECQQPLRHQRSSCRLASRIMNVSSPSGNITPSAKHRLWSVPETGTQSLLSSIRWRHH